MAQQYIQKFEYRSASESEFDQAWAVALQTLAKTGNWGGVEAGVRHIKTFGVITHPGMDIGWVSSAVRMARMTAVWLAFAVLTTERNAA